MTSRGTDQACEGSLPEPAYENRESSSRSSKERKRNSRSNSKSSSQSSPSYGCTVKGTSAIILTPDSIVYNDEGIWSHRYDTSPRPH